MQSKLTRTSSLVQTVNSPYMQDFSVTVKKLTDDELMRRACEMTFNGTSHQSLTSIYKSEHSPARTQLFWIEAKHIPLFVSTHLLRHHVGSIPFQLSCRDDRKGGNVGFKDKIENVIGRINQAQEMSQIGDWMASNAYNEVAIDELHWLQKNADRYTPVNLGLLVNAQSLIDMAKLRLCKQAHVETIKVFKAIKEAITKVDPELASMMVRKCVYRGGLCGEPKCCGFNSTKQFQIELRQYAHNFTKKQQGTMKLDETN